MVTASGITKGVITGLITTGLIIGGKRVLANVDENSLSVNLGDLSIPSDFIDVNRLKMKVALDVTNRLDKSISISNPGIFIDYYQQSSGQYKRLADNVPGMQKTIPAKESKRIWVAVTTQVTTLASIAFGDILSLVTSGNFSNIKSKLKNSKFRVTYDDNIAGFDFNKKMEFGPGTGNQLSEKA